MSARTGSQEALRVFVAGASGAVGQALVPKLVAAGYAVTAMTRFPGNAETLRALGAAPVVCDVFDAERVGEAVAAARPAVVVNQLTELPRSGLKPKRLGEYYARNDRVRREGTEKLLSAALAAGARRYVGQSVAFWYEPSGNPVKDEDAALWRDAPSPIGAAVHALESSEKLVLDAAGIEGVVLRYGTFYGPRTWYTADGEIGRQMAKRRYPIIGRGEGYTSFVHVQDAADACVAFVERGAPGVYNVVDDEPAQANEWMPFFAERIGAKRPRRVPERVARVLTGKALAKWSATSRGASNAKVKRELGWTPAYASWRRGFDEALA